MTVVWFGLFTMINVVLQTMKSILTVKSGRQVAAIINAATYGFYTIVLKQLADVPMVTSVIVTVVCNYVGVQIAIFILDRFKKDKMWIFEVTYLGNDIANFVSALENAGLKYVMNDAQYMGGACQCLRIFAPTQLESSIASNILKGVNARYCVTETK